MSDHDNPIVESSGYQSSMPSKPLSSGDEVKDEKIIPLRQVEISELLKENNVVAHLKTGSTKTLIARVVIDHILDHYGIGSMAVLVVNRIPLVTQHAVYLRRLTKRKIKVVHYYGDLGLTSWRTKKWVQQLKSTDIAVMTGQAFLNALRHALIPLDVIKLLIFDECHLATGDHPYTLIMDYYRNMEHSERLPKILAVTAGLVDSTQLSESEGVSRAMSNWKMEFHELENTFSAIYLSLLEDERTDANTAVSKRAATETVHLYNPHPSLNEPQRALSRGRYEKAIEDADDRLFGDPMFYELLENDSSTSYAEIQKDAMLLCTYIEESLGLVAAREMKLRMSDGRYEVGDFQVCDRVADKAAQLIAKLTSEYRHWKNLYPFTRFRCIVFVRHRCSAWSLTKLINCAVHGVGGGELYAKSVTSYCTKTGKSSKRSRVPWEQQEILEQFRRGDFGILVATDILKANMDIPSCGLVIVFDEIRSTVSLDRMRDRARGSSSRFIVLAPRYGLENVRTSRNIQLVYIAAELPAFVTSTKKKLRGLQLRQKSMSVAYHSHVLRSATTRAVVPASAAELLLASYCEILPRDMEGCSLGSLKPNYDVKETPEGFVCKVTLPPNSVVREGSCALPQTSSVGSRATAALDAYGKLYNMKLVDEYLLPHWPSYLDGVESQQERDWDELSLMAVPEGKEESVVCGCLCQPKALMWDKGAGPPWAVFMYLILPEKPNSFSEEDFRGSSTHALITRNEILDDDLDALSFPSGEHLFSLKYVKCLSITRTQYKSATEYVQRVQGVSANRAYRLEEGYFRIENPGYLLVPVQKNSDSPANYDILWKKIAALNSYKFNDLTTWPEMLEEDMIQNLEHAIVQCRHDNRALMYFTTKLDRKLSPLSPHPMEDTRFATYYEYFRERHYTEIKLKHQPLLQTTEMWSSSKSDSMRYPFYVVPELCRVVPLEKYTVFLVKQLSWWQRYMAIKEAYRHLGFARRGASVISFARALTPCTSASLSQNYERLEFLGDAVLKFLATLYTFHVKGVAHEGVMSFYRNQRIGNDNLFKFAVVNCLERAAAYTISTMCMEKFEYLLAPQGKEYKIPCKVLADIVEALLGLTYLGDGLKASIQLLDDLGITQTLKTIVQNPFREVILKPIEDKRVSDKRLEIVEATLGYCFNNKLLLVEALTHPSFNSACTASYQRLEFLGDAVMGFVITDQIYKAYRNLSPADLTLVRENAISNQLFGLTLIRLSLHEHIYYDSPALKSDIEAVVQKERDTTRLHGRIPCPKVLGDVLEALVGAIVIDSTNDVSRIWELLGHALLPLMQRFCDPVSLLKHPVPRCSHMIRILRREEPVYRFRKLADTKWDYEDTGESEDIRTVCEILVDGKLLARTEGKSRKLAKRHAAEYVCHMLQDKYDTRLQEQALDCRMGIRNL